MEWYQMNNGWDDVTAISRNEIVFEGRNKEYGAYALRVYYPRTLLLALLLTSLLALACGTMPAVIRLLWNGTKVIKTNYFITSHLTRYREKAITPVVTHPFKPAIQPASAIKNPPPVITKWNIADTLSTHSGKEIVSAPGGKEGSDTANFDPAGGKGNVPLIPDIVPLPVIPTIVEKMPKFNGDMQHYFNTNIIYPDYEKSAGIGGTVYLSFVVEKDGTISNVKLLHGVAGAPNLNNEAMRVVQAMPAWLPGEQSGHKVRVQFNLPVKFSVE